VEKLFAHSGQGLFRWKNYLPTLGRDFSGGKIICPLWARTFSVEMLLAHNRYLHFPRRKSLAHNGYMYFSREKILAHNRYLYFSHEKILAHNGDKP